MFLQKQDDLHTNYHGPGDLESKKMHKNTNENINSKEIVNIVKHSLWEQLQELKSNNLSIFKMLILLFDIAILNLPSLIVIIL